MTEWMLRHDPIWTTISFSFGIFPKCRFFYFNSVEIFSWCPWKRSALPEAGVHFHEVADSLSCNGRNPRMSSNPSMLVAAGMLSVTLPG